MYVVAAFALDNLRASFDNLRIHSALEICVQPYIRGGVLEYFAETAEQLGGDVSRLLAEADVAPEVLTLSGVFLPYSSYLRLMHLAARHTGTAHFGLLMARSSNAETLGTIGITMTQADTVGAAWETLSHFYRIHDTYGEVRMERQPDRVVISYGLPRYNQAGTRQVVDVAAGITCNIMQRLCGSGFEATELAFPYRLPEDVSVFSDLPCDQVSFDAKAMEVVVPEHYMRQKLARGAEELQMVFDGYRGSHGASRRSLARQVEDMIRRLMPTGTCTLPRVAATLATTPRTLQAKLEQEQCSFRDILENVRKEIATFHLRRGDMQLTQLAMVLGYSELSAFSRSFRSWYGESPRKWALRQQKADEIND